MKEWIHSVEDKSSDEASTCCVINSIVDVRQEIFQIKRCELNCEGMTALHFAVLYCKKNIVEILLKAGAGMELLSAWLRPQRVWPVDNFIEFN